ncbi:hypothetical protein SCOCK_30082 [Actinacidiphila cocklensis]|uniref:Uncharacterized protein n=1 Tax=Actinacidiphila cocklensis TaxID=887465 RepID=A0A9W4GRX7_9ACTN|nr:hypothetical protein SCOCK_30082 [Actinacidiphila cocklensis]
MKPRRKLVKPHRRKTQVPRSITHRDTSRPESSPSIGRPWEGPSGRQHAPRPVHRGVEPEPENWQHLFTDSALAQLP